jgi:membrane fusion protein (multidrug efflux system)
MFMILKKAMVCNVTKIFVSRPVLKALLMMMIITVVGLSFVSCSKEKAEPERLVNVRVWSAETRRVQPYLETIGTLKPDEEVLVTTEVDGIVRKIYVDEGTNVSAGTLLAEINDTDYVLDVRRSEAALRQAEAQQVNARRSFKRLHTLYQEELITKQQFDDISTKVALAEADLEKARATLSISREKLSRTKIYSPIVASIKEKKVSVGDFVRNGTSLFQIIRTNPLKLRFNISEKDVAGLKKGQDVAFTVDAFSKQKFHGKVSLLYPSVEEKTRTLQAEAIVPNEGQILKPGYFARVQIFTQEARDSVVVPVTALLYDGSIVRVFVIDGNQAKERIIKTGNKYGEHVEVMDGLKEGDQVVVIGQNNLSEGVKVHVAR